jgi:hypothetical protein
MPAIAEGGPGMRRTTHRSSTGTKLYAVRDRSGRFKDIQTFKRAHAADLRSKSADEVAAAAAPKKEAVAKKVAKKKATAKKKVTRK